MNESSAPVAPLKRQARRETRLRDADDDPPAIDWDAVYVAALLCECVYKIAETGSGDAFVGALRHALAQGGARVSSPVSSPGDRLAGETLRVLPSRRDIPQRYVLADCTAVPGLVFCCFMGTKTIADVRVNVDVGVRGGRNRLLWRRALGILSTVRTLRQFHCALGGRRLVLCGHSLGGMLAQLVASLLGEEARADVGLVTFGSPGVPGLPGLGESSQSLERHGSACVVDSNLRVNVVARGDLIVRGAQRVLAENNSNYVGRLLEVGWKEKADTGVGFIHGIHGIGFIHGHGMHGYRRLVELLMATEGEEKEGTLASAADHLDRSKKSNPPSVVRGDQGLVPQVSVRRVDVRVADEADGADGADEAGGGLKGGVASATVSAHGRWIGMGRWTAVDWRLQAASYEDDFRDGVQRFPFKVCKL